MPSLGGGSGHERNVRVVPLMQYSAGYNLTGTINENSATGSVSPIAFSGQFLIPTTYNLQASGDPSSGFGEWVYNFPTINLNWTVGESTYQFSESQISVSYTLSASGTSALLTYDCTGNFAGWGPMDIGGFGKVPPGSYESYMGPGLEGGNLTVNFPYGFETDSIGYDIGSITSVTQFVPCFMAGTRVATASGAVPVETLQAGERICSIFGRAPRAISIAHRSVDCRSHQYPHEVWPVRIQAHALGRELPMRDLWLSPDHALYLNRILIPVRYLINGTTIARLPVDWVAYWHVQLPEHDVILAEGVPVESYLDTGNRAAFSPSGDGLTAPRLPAAHCR